MLRYNASDVVNDSLARPLPRVRCAVLRTPAARTPRENTNLPVRFPFRFFGRNGATSAAAWKSSGRKRQRARPRPDNSAESFLAFAAAPSAGKRGQKVSRVVGRCSRTEERRARRNLLCPDDKEPRNYNTIVGAPILHLMRPSARIANNARGPKERFPCRSEKEISPWKYRESARVIPHESRAERATESSLNIVQLPLPPLGS